MRSWWRSRAMKALWGGATKTDQVDAECLARMARVKLLDRGIGKSNVSGTWWWYGDGTNWWEREQTD